MGAKFMLADGSAVGDLLSAGVVDRDHASADLGVYPFHWQMANFGTYSGSFLDGRHWFGALAGKDLRCSFHFPFLLPIAHRHSAVLGALGRGKEAALVGRSVGA